MTESATVTQAVPTTVVQTVVQNETATATEIQTSVETMMVTATQCVPLLSYEYRLTIRQVQVTQTQVENITQVQTM